MKFHLTMVVGALVLVGCGAPGEEDQVLTDDEQGLAARGQAGNAAAGAGAATGASKGGPLPPPPVVNGTFSTTPNWVVGIVVGNGGCTGWVVNPHHILTSAHCFAGAADGAQITVSRASGLGTRTQIYQGPASFNRHPNFANTADHDVQVVRLWSHGLPVEITGQARMYSDSRRTWKESSPTFISAGWGQSVINPNDATDCVAGGAFALRTSGALAFDRSTTDIPAVVSAPLGTQFPCSGDSGSPWLASRGGDLLGFALHSRRNGSPRKARATTLADNAAWIEATIGASGTINRYGQYCFERDSGGFRWRQCDEIARGWGQLKRDNTCIQADALTPGSELHAAACGVSTSISTQAFGLVPSGEILALGPNLCLEATSAANQAPVKVATCNGSLNQRFANSPSSELRLGLDWNMCVTSIRNGPVIDTSGGVLTTNLTAAMATPGAVAPADLTEGDVAALASTDAQTAAPAVTAQAQAFGPFGPASIKVAPCNGSPSQRWVWQ